MNPETSPVAKTLTYQEFPQKFVYNEQDKEWHIRKNGFALGRMYFVPSNITDERFYLRTLLVVVKGPVSFESLRTFGGVTYPTFRDACVARGLLEDDGEWRQCLLEASCMQTGERLRHLFVTLLLFCSPSKPEQLWDHFRGYICDDLQYRLQCSRHLDPQDDEIFDYGLWLIGEILGKTWRKRL